jgi:hypothetical protein
VTGVVRVRPTVSSVVSGMIVSGVIGVHRVMPSMIVFVVSHGLGVSLVFGRMVRMIFHLITTPTWTIIQTPLRYTKRGCSCNRRTFILYDLKEIEGALVTPKNLFHAGNKTQTAGPQTGLYFMRRGYYIRCSSGMATVTRTG